MMYDDFKAMLKNVRKSGSGFIARCPAHADKNPSLSVSLDGKKILVMCRAGCQTEAIVGELGLSMRDLFVVPDPAYKRANGRRSEIVDVYKYCDEKGEILYETVKRADKTFSRRRPDGRGGYIWNWNGVRRVPYRLPELIAAINSGEKQIYLCEGEKDADNVRSLGLPTTNLKDWRPEFNRFVQDCHTVIIRDHDKPGVKLADKTAGILLKDIKAVRIIDLFDSEPMPDKEGMDVSDWILAEKAAGSDHKMIARKLAAAADGATEWVPGATEDKNTGKDLQPLSAIRMTDVVARPVRWLWVPFLALGAFSILDGIEGIGKTFMILRVAAAVALGKGLPGIYPKDHIEASNVLLISAEDSLEFVVKPRLEAMNAPCDRIIAVQETFEFDVLGIERLSLVMDQYKPRLVIIDPLFSRVGRINLNNDNEVRAITDGLNKLAEKYDCAIVGIRHLNKSKGFGDARNAGLNGIGWRAGCRSNLLVGVDPNDDTKKAVLQTKNNLAPIYEGALGFTIENGVCEWTGPSDLTAEMMLSHKESVSVEEGGAKREAMDFLLEELANGPRLSAELLAEANSAGIKAATLRRAKKALKIASKKRTESNGGWCWMLKNGQDVQTAEDAHEDDQF